MLSRSGNISKDEQLLMDTEILKEVPNHNRDLNCKTTCKSFVILFIVFLACAPLAFLISTLMVYLYEEVYFETTLPSNDTFKFSIIKESTTVVEGLTTNSKVDSKNLPPAASCGKRIVGYYTEWEAPEVTEKQLRKLTHVIYLFAAVNPDGTLKLDNNRTEARLLDMKNKAIAINTGLKMMIGVGGHANSPRFAPLVADLDKRRILIDSIATFIDAHDLNGVDVFWIWSTSSDKLNYFKFIQELRKKLTELKLLKGREEDYIISVVAPPSTIKVDNGYYLNEILKYINFVNVLTYDYYFNGNRIGPHSPLYGGTRGNIDETMSHLTCKTRQPSKLNMAVPFYGTFWSNASLPLGESDEIWKTIDSAKGPFAVRWRELIPNGWDKKSAEFHEKSKTSFIWIPKSKHFLSFENERSLKEKAEYVRNKNLGGIIVWAIDQDDDENTLLNVVASADLCSKTEKDTVRYTCNN